MNKEGIWVVVLQKTGSIQEKRSVSKMYLIVNLRIRLFASKDKYLLPYRRSSSILLFKLSEYLKAARTSLTPAKRVCLCSWKALQSSKKCFVSSMPSFTGDIGLIYL